MSTPTAPLPFLGEDDLALLHACGAEIQARRGEILIREGETTTDLLLAVEGVIAIETDGVAIAHCGPGEVWGEISMLEDAAASATARAEQDARVVRIPRVALEALLKSHEQLASTSATLARGGRRSGIGAVDYETAQMIVRPIPSGDGVLGPLVDEWFLERPLCKLRRAAAQEIHAWLVAEAKAAPSRVCAVGGGTFSEALDAIEDVPPEELYVTCVDLDADRSRRVRTDALDGGLLARTSFLCADGVELAQGGPETSLAPQERIYSLEL